VPIERAKALTHLTESAETPRHEPPATQVILHQLNEVGAAATIATVQLASICCCGGTA
jgi:hypothetical protein